MWGYIAGIIIGSILMVISLVIFSLHFFKKVKHNNKLKTIGLKSETKINGDIKTWAKQTKNFFIPACLFKYNENKLFEVDSILVTPYALFVIEIKSIKGVIKGDSEKTNWIKQLGTQEFKIKNPIFQNEKHIEHIMKMLNLRVPTVSLIIFSNRADYIDVKNIPSHVLVFKHSKLFDNLDSIEKILPISMNEYEMRTLYGKIKSFKTSKRKDIIFHKKITTKGRV